MPANSVLAKAPYKIPVVVDTDRLCITVPCPNDPDHIANFLEAIATLGLWSNYQLESDRKAKPVADVWMEIYRVVEESLCDCALRNGPGGIEQFNQSTGLWTPVQGNSAQGDPRVDGHVDPPWTAPPSGQEGNCLTAANIAGTFKDMMVDFGAKLVAAAGFATMLMQVEAWLALELPLIGEVIVIATEMAAAALDAGSVVFVEAFDPSTRDANYHDLQCVISCHCAADGTITSGDVATMKEVFATKLPHGLDPVEAALWLLFVNDFLDSQGPNGLMKLGHSSNISSADCSDCDCGWCAYFDFRVASYGWVSRDDDGFSAYRTDGVGWRASNPALGRFDIKLHMPADVHITKGDVAYTMLNGRTFRNTELDLPLGTHINLTQPLPIGTDLTAVGPVVSVTGQDFFCDLVKGVDSDGDPILIGIKLFGDGDNPFTDVPTC